ncbi:LptF/LptG family permease [Sulfuricurvum sp.]|uniref:LptF/LptG family permease n=1 Tax=Sulfuricurvum sp. TaxID=2025608 RepID=UPI0019BD729E|nr:LptF/LptG family permease [Sulfuricurvum sp.]MBD3798750.1 LptF/LptG family permease [Campylobacterota bacterium]MBD3805841.1 LptF/LptG family permease [Sulfuricurvum sp.]
MLAFTTLSSLYLRYFFIVLIALCSFMVGFDLMENASELPDSANLVMIYIMYKYFYAIDMMLPISLVFALIASLAELIRANTLVAYFALGYSKIRIMTPFLVIAGVMLVSHIALHFTNFTRANEFANNLRETSQFIRPTSNLFFTYEGNYIFFGNLYPLSKKAEEIRIFTFKDGKLKESLSASEATYHKGYWNIPKAHVIQLPEAYKFKGGGFISEDREELKVLRDFKPKILDQVYEGKANFTIQDAFDALKLLENQNVDVDKITSALYRIFISPWFAPILMVLFFTYTPVSGRFLNLSLFSFMAILITLIVWGVLFMMGELSNNKTLSPEIGVIAPIGMLVLFMFWRLGNPLRRVRVKSR